MDTPYTGRFAPSPTGELHLGSLTCALAGWLDARAAGGRWLLRIEDLDPPREKPGAADAIRRQLEDHGLLWDGEVVFQSRRTGLYEAALERLARDGLAFRCPLSRSQLEALGQRHPGRGVAAGVDVREFAWRFDAPDTDAAWVDRVQGPQSANVARSEGPFVIRRRDGLFAYQLAVVVDDAAQGVTDIVRGSDLLDSTPRQLLLQRALGLPTPRYAHIPVLASPSGEKLSKQEAAAPVTRARRMDNLRLALRALGQAPQDAAGDPAALLAAATAAWDIGRVPRRAFLPLPDLLQGVPSADARGS